MNIFISWSGGASRAIAEVLRDWLPGVIQAAQPWMSDEDIGKGTRWSQELSEKLRTTHAGIICVTPDNQERPWLNFEIGGLAKTVAGSLVCPYLWRLRPADLKGPIAQFQATEASSRDDTLKMLRALNAALAEKALLEKTLEKTFEVWWPQLQTAIQGIQVPPQATVVRPDREVLEEILDILRQQTRLAAENESRDQRLVPADREYRLLKPGVAGARYNLSDYVARLRAGATQEQLDAVKGADWVTAIDALSKAGKSAEAVKPEPPRTDEGEE